jgi:hypothetical protein
MGAQFARRVLPYNPQCQGIGKNGRLIEQLVRGAMQSGALGGPAWRIELHGVPSSGLKTILGPMADRRQPLARTNINPRPQALRRLR